MTPCVFTSIFDEYTKTSDPLALWERVRVRVAASFELLHYQPAEGAAGLAVETVVRSAS